MKHLCLIMLTTLLLSACAQPSARMPEVSEGEISGEKKVQESMAAEKELRKLDNRMKMQERLNKVYGPIAQAAVGLCGQIGALNEENKCIYPAVLKESGPLNAWADGEKIHVTPAMMAFANSDDELAFVLAHEVAHNMMKHVDSTQTNALAGQIVGALLDGLAASQGFGTHGAFQSLGGSVGQLTYSQAFEREADYIGLYLLAHAGRNYRETSDYWRRLSMRDPDAIYVNTTHPSNPERFVRMEKTAAEIDGKKRQKLALLPEFEKAEAELSPAAGTRENENKE